MQELMTAADREYAPSGRAWTAPTHSIEDDHFAHVLIDEAQDLTPMQWRMVGRRGRIASWTIVGDPAQSSWPDARGVGRGPGRGTGREGAPRVPPLDELPQLLRDLRLRRGVRRAGRPGRRPADGGAFDRGGAAGRRPGARTSRRTRRPRSPRWRATSPAPWASSYPSRVAPRSTPGSPRGRSAPKTLPAPGPRSTPRWRRRARTGRGANGLDTKGLEFDGIVVVRPQEIEDESQTGRATLYVVFTRATQLLTILE